MHTQQTMQIHFKVVALYACLKHIVQDTGITCHAYNTQCPLIMCSALYSHLCPMNVQLEAGFMMVLQNITACEEFQQRKRNMNMIGFVESSGLPSNMAERTEGENVACSIPRIYMYRIAGN